MLHFIQICGFFGWPLVLLALVEAALVGRVALRLRAGGGGDPETGRRIDTILFWGLVAAVMGFLGQAQGIYNAMRVIMAAREISPQKVAQGFAESFSTTLFGLSILLAAGLAWLALRAWHGRVERRPQAA